MMDVQGLEFVWLWCGPGAVQECGGESTAEAAEQPLAKCPVLQKAAASWPDREPDPDSLFRR